jgi:FAD/FMN-containing dehydrogenase
MHTADNLAPGVDPVSNQTLRIDHQVLPENLFGLLPKSILHHFMRPFWNNSGMRLVNAAKYLANRTIGQDSRHRQSHVAFNFLLDYIPHWERAYGRGGLIQYQCFIPTAAAEGAFAEILRRGLKHRLPNYLTVLKRHREDDFLLSHAVDGFSLAQDYRVTPRNRGRLEQLVAELDEIVLAAGGRFYFAKDSTLNARNVRRFLGDETVDSFIQLKRELDPECVLESDLYRRCFGM